MKNLLPIAVLVAAVAASVVPATAAPSISLVQWDEPRSVTVRHRDLDLSSPGGIDTLHRRIELAVARVCVMPNAEQLGQRARAATCREIARRQALDQASRVINASAISALAR